MMRTQPLLLFLTGFCLQSQTYLSFQILLHLQFHIPDSVFIVAKLSPLMGIYSQMTSNKV